MHLVADEEIGNRWAGQVITCTPGDLCIDNITTYLLYVGLIKLDGCEVSVLFNQVRFIRIFILQFLKTCKS